MRGEEEMKGRNWGKSYQSIVYACRKLSKIKNWRKKKKKRQIEIPGKSAFSHKRALLDPRAEGLSL